MSGYNKYGVSSKADRTVHGQTFDSKAEAHRYLTLVMRERAGEIADLETQVEYVLVPACVTTNGTKVRAVRYYADFRYLDLATNKRIVEDVKGCRTQTYIVKLALLLWRYPDINFVEIAAK